MKTAIRGPYVFHQGWMLFLAGLLLAASTWACNLPVRVSSDSADQIEQLIADFQPMVTNIRLDGPKLIIDYHPAMLEPRESSLVNTLELIKAGAIMFTQVEQVQVTLYSIVSPDSPLISTWVDAKIARQYVRDEINIETFLESWQLNDLRTPEMKMVQQLNDLGYKDVQVNQVGADVVIAYRQSMLSNSPGFIESWLSIFDLAAKIFPDADMLILQIGGLENQRISSPAKTVRDLHSGKMGVADFLLQMEISEND